MNLLLIVLWTQGSDSCFTNYSQEKAIPGDVLSNTVDLSACSHLNLRLNELKLNKMKSSVPQLY